ncbi:protein dispatched homolog 1-like [Diadema antillarum]|uniref:protein dispatched homolog 1-like n=1 Tax=Diadema antillarum TaxID=105358 RepID=UPI003A8B1A8C
MTVTPVQRTFYHLFAVGLRLPSRSGAGPSQSKQTGHRANSYAKTLLLLHGDAVEAQDSHLSGWNTGRRNQEGSGDDGVDTRVWESGFEASYARLVVRFPSLVLVLVFALATCTGVIGIFTNALPSFSDPSKGFQSRGTDLSGRLLAFERYVEATDQFYPYPSTVSGTRRRRSPEQETGHRTTRDTTNSGTVDQLGTCGNSLSDRLRMVYKSTGRQGMFTKDAMIAVCQHDNDNYRTQDTFNETCDHLDTNGDCCPTLSLGHLTALITGKDSCVDIDEEDVLLVQELLGECVENYTAGCFADDHNCTDLPANCSSHGSVVYIILHYLTPADFLTSVTDGSFDLQFAMALPPLDYASNQTRSFYDDHMGGSSLSSEAVGVVAIGAGFKIDLFREYILSDSVFIGVGCALVVLIIWIYVGSFFITSMTIVGMLMSILVAYFLYKTVFRLPFFPYINILATVLIIGIGADDCFVFVDIWKLTKNNTVNRGKNLESVFRETLRHASATMFVTSLTTSSALYAGIVNSITAIRCFSVFAGTAILVNFILTLTWIPAAVVIHDKYFLNKSGNRTATDNKCLTCWFSVGELYNGVAKAGNKLFLVYLPIIISKFRLLCIIVLSGLGIGAICVVYVAPGLRLPSQSHFQVFRTSHILEQYDQIYRPTFAFESDLVNYMPAFIVWGIEPLDNGNHWDPDSKGITVMDQTFNLSSETHQEWMYNLCADFRNSTFHNSEVNSTSEYCFMDSFRDFMEGPCINPVTGGDLSPCCGQTNFPYSASNFRQCVILYHEVRCQLSTCDYTSPGLRFDADDNIVAMNIYFLTNTEESQDYAATDQFWSDMNTWVENQMETAPEGLRNGWSISTGTRQLYFFDLQRGLALGTPLSIGLSLAIAACVLLLTIRNFLVTVYAMFTIACAVFVVVGSVVLLGWELNIFESIIISLAVGLSVDFTIHYGVSYRQATATDKESRSIYALSSVGAAITLAALTTFVAGALMMPSVVLSYLQLGTFLMLVMTLSWVYGTFLFISLCYTIGPEGTFAQFSRDCCRKTLSNRRLNSIDIEKPPRGHEEICANENKVDISGTGVHAWQDCVEIKSNPHFSIGNAQREFDSSKRTVIFTVDRQTEGTDATIKHSVDYEMDREDPQELSETTAPIGNGKIDTVDNNNLGSRCSIKVVDV